MNPSNQPVFLHKIETVVPKKFYTQEFALKKYKELLKPSIKEKILLNKLFKGTHIKKRHTVIDDYDKEPEKHTFYPKNKLLKPEPSTAARNDLYIEKAQSLAHKAVSQLFKKNPNFDPALVTHLITISCTGFTAPGIAFYLVRDLNLNSTIHRYNIGFMGCQGAFPGMKLAQNICLSESEARVLVVNIELCSIHFQQSRELDILVSNAIFADGVSAALISSHKGDMNGPKFILNEFKTDFAEKTDSDMAWKIGETGFLMKLSRYVPSIVKHNIKPVMDTLFEECGLSKSDIDIWAIHPGGRAILEKCEEILDISKEDLYSAYQIMYDYGNMSSTTIMFVLEHIRNDSQQMGKVFAAAFGPGITIEAGFLEKIK